jgi:hypothetical protein
MTTDSNNRQIDPVRDDLPKVALVVGTEVLQIMAVDEATLAAFKSNPVFVDLGFNPDRILPGDAYNPSTGKFTRYEDVLIARAKAAGN